VSLRVEADMSTTKKKKRKNKSIHTVAIHGKAKDGTDVVEIGNLRVIIVKDDDAWFAQGLEIDYAVQGSSVENVKRKFERGLCATIHENLKAFGNIERILRVAPQEVWNELFYNPSRKLKEYSSVSLHDMSKSLKLEGRTPQIKLPFDAIRFVESKPAA
jgi:hypothetical protein